MLKYYLTTYPYIVDVIGELKDFEIDFQFDAVFAAGVNHMTNKYDNDPEKDQVLVIFTMNNAFVNSMVIDKNNAVTALKYNSNHPASDDALVRQFIKAYNDKKWIQISTDLSYINR